jgi:hypothetical protein
MTERPWLAGYEPPTEYGDHQPTFAAPCGSALDVVRHGPGVPSAAGVAAPGAAGAGRTGRHAGTPPGRRGLRRILGLALTVILLAAAGVVLWLRFHHAPFGVTGVAIIQQTKTPCGVDVTGRITTNGSAGTVSYQWVFRPQTQAPQPLNQSVVTGQHAVYVTVAVEGQGHGRSTQEVTLDVLGPAAGTASKKVSVSC